MARQARKSKADFAPSLEEPIPVGQPLDEVIERAGLITADQLPTPDQTVQEAARRLGVSGDFDPSPELIVSEVPPVEKEVVEPSDKHVRRLIQTKFMRPTPTGFMGEEGHYHAGIRLSRSLDKAVVGIQFSDDHKPSRDGLNPETQQMRDRGFLYNPMHSQWERVDRENPAANYQDARDLVHALVQDRLGGPQESQGRGGR